jgi:Tol biopolymer transport system component
MPAPCAFDSRQPTVNPEPIDTDPELMSVENTNTHSVRRALAGAAAFALVTLLWFAAWAPSAFGDPAAYAGASADGENVFFTTTEKLVPGDTDNKRDVYERFYDSEPGIESYVTREVSTGPAGGNDSYDVSFDAVSEDGLNGLRVFFSTAESLVGEDKDLSTDIYMRNLNTGATILVSKADPSCPAADCGNAAGEASFDAVSADGARVVFSTDEALSEEDQDTVEDVYVRDISGATTTLVSKAAPSCSAPNCGNGAQPAFFEAASTDALTVAFGSVEALSGEDVDSTDDIYARDVQGGVTSLVSPAGACPLGLGQSECTPIFGGMSGDGSHVFYETGEQVAAGQDTDEGQDVYAWSGAAPALVSTGAGGGNGGADATYEGTTADGSAAFFETSEVLASGDEDGTGDVYMRSGGGTSLVSTGPTDGPAGSPANFEKASSDGAAVVFATAEKLTIQDTDSKRDIYVRDTGAESTALVSQGGSGCIGTCGAGAFEAGFAGASSDGSIVFFETAEPLVPADTDTSADVYQRAGGQTTLVSTGPTSKNGASNPHLADVSGNGAHVLITTEERLTIDDLDTETDIYDRSASGILLVSTRNPDELVLGPAVPALTKTSPASPGVSTEPRVFGEADAGTSIKLYATPDCSGAPVATGSGEGLEETGIAVKVAPGSTTSFHATATLLNDTSACSTTSATYRQVADEGAGGGGGGGSGGGAGSGSGSGAGGTGGGQSGAGRNAGGAQAFMPHTRITFAPASKTRLRRPTFQFIDSTEQTGTRFLCAVDRGRWRSCGSPTKLKALGRGRHVFKVKGVNSGLEETAPATRSFRVVAR